MGVEFLVTADTTAALAGGRPKSQQCIREAEKTQFFFYTLVPMARQVQVARCKHR